MRDVKEKYGIIFIDQNTIVIRVYETDEHEWRLTHYINKQLATYHPVDLNSASFAEAIAELLTNPQIQHIAEWRTFTRAIPDTIVCDLKAATGLSIESLSPLREQELLCKGMFTEFW